jgi:hypothetical protein
MMSRPRLWNLVDSDSSLCVPTTMSTVPSAMPLMAAVISLPERKRDTSATFTGHLPKSGPPASGSAARPAAWWAPEGHLLAAGDGHEGRAQGDLGLAKADVAADQAVHGARADHVLDDGVDGGVLVGRFLKAEVVGEGS